MIKCTQALTVKQLQNIVPDVFADCNEYFVEFMQNTAIKHCFTISKRLPGPSGVVENLGLRPRF